MLFRMDEIKNTFNINFWQECRITGVLICCSCEIIEPLWKTASQFLIKLNIGILFNMAEWDENSWPHKKLHMIDFISFMHNCCKSKQNVFKRWRINKHPYDRVILSNENKWAIKPKKCMKESSMHITKLRKSTWKKLLIYTIWFQLHDILEKPNYIDSKNISRCLNLNYSVWYYNGGYTTLCICHIHRPVQHEKWTLLQTMDFS